MSRLHDKRFPGESDAYREARAVPVDPHVEYADESDPVFAVIGRRSCGQ